MKYLLSSLTLACSAALASPGNDGCVGNCAPNPGNDGASPVNVNNTASSTAVGGMGGNATGGAGGAGGSATGGSANAGGGNVHSVIGGNTVGIGPVTTGPSTATTGPVSNTNTNTSSSTSGATSGSTAVGLGGSGGAGGSGWSTSNASGGSGTGFGGSATGGSASVTGVQGGSSSVATGPVAVSVGDLAPAANASVTFNTPAEQTVRQTGTVRVENTPDAQAIIASPTAVCRVTFGVGGSGPGIGISFGSSVLDEGCDAREDSRLLHNMGLHVEAVLRLCAKPEMAKALGSRCPVQ